MRLALLAVLLVGCGAPVVRPPRLVVLVVVDQLPSWSFTDRAPLMRHGFARLMKQGFYWRQARYPYAATLTAPGHAALGAGAPPATTGILGNAWYRRDLGELVDSTWDPASPRLGLVTKVGSSPALLRVEGVGDRVVQAGGKAVGVGVKDRAAMLPQGKHPTLAVWFDAAEGRFLTSRWYAEANPAWLDRLAAEHPIPPRTRGYVWTPQDPTFLAAHTSVADDTPCEGAGEGSTFPHRFPADQTEVDEVIKTSPLGATVTRELAEAALTGEALGTDDLPDFLSVSFANTDYVGHRWGQESWESLETLLRLDEELGLLFDALDARVGRDRWAVVLTTDHGATRMVEHTGGRRVSTEEVAGAIGVPLAAIREPYAFLRDKASDAELDAMVARVAKVPGISGAWRTDRIAGGCAARPEPERSVCWSVDPERAGEIYFMPAAGSIILDKEHDPVSHGTANPDDVTVPILMMGPGIRAGVSDDPVSTLRVAPTLARLLGVPAPPAAKEQPLGP